jgi:hypothetical protein
MNCPNCGQQVEPGAVFCGNCGQNLQTAPAPSQPAAEYVASTPPPVPIAPITPLAPAYPSPIAQGYQNAASLTPVVPYDSPNPLTPAAPGYTQFPGTMAVPAKSGEIIAILAVLAGALGIPGALIPIVGLVLGTASVVLGSLSLKTTKHALGLVGMIIGIIAILLSLGTWAFVAAHGATSHSNTSRQGSTTSPISTASTAAGAQSATTPCYVATFPSSLALTQGKTSCTLTARTQAEEYTVNSSSNNSVTESNFASIAKQSLEQTTKSIGITVQGEQNAVFAGSTAFVVQGYYNANNQKTIVAVVLHPTADGENLFIIEHVMLTGAVDLNAIESSWQWK